MSRPTLYLDLASPYAYLAATRAASVLGTEVELQPVLLGAMFKLRGWGSWAHTDERGAGMTEIERRAEHYGLAPIVWPEDWPCNSLGANRAAIWAKQQGAAEPFVLAVYREEFGHGADVANPETLRTAARAAELDPDELVDGTQRPEIKDALRRATEEAWKLGVRGVPSLRVGDAVFFGDDQLEAAALARPEVDLTGRPE